MYMYKLQTTVNGPVYMIIYIIIETRVTVYMYNYGEKRIPMVGFMLCDIIAGDFLMS